MELRGLNDRQLEAVKATEEEVNLNPRSRSAKLRVIEVKEA